MCEEGKLKSKFSERFPFYSALFRTVIILNQGSQSSSELVGGTCGLLSNNPERGIRIDMPKTESGEDVGDQGKRSRKMGLRKPKSQEKGRTW